MYIDIAIKELDELEKKKERISSNNYLNECEKLQKKYQLYKKMDNDNMNIINMMNNNTYNNNNNNNNNNDNDDYYDLKK